MRDGIMGKMDGALLCGRRVGQRRRTQRFLDSVRVASPITISNLSRDSQDSVVGGVGELSDQIREELRAGANDSLQLGAHLAGEREEYVRVLVEFGRKRDDRRLARRRLIASLNLRKIRGLDSDSFGDLSKAEAAVLRP